MRTTTIQCNRCGQNILGDHSVLIITAGDLVRGVEDGLKSNVNC